MKPAHKIALVAVGYLLAMLVAMAAVALNAAAGDAQDRLALGGMHALGDALVFLAVFVVASVPATGAALVFLRTVARFWAVLSALALLIAASALAAMFAFLAQPPAAAGSAFPLWVTLAPLRVLVAPLLALTFVVSGLLAPGRATRNALLSAAAIEVLVFTIMALVWFQQIRVN